MEYIPKKAFRNKFFSISSFLLYPQHSLTSPSTAAVMMATATVFKSFSLTVGCG